ncbi:MAG: RluA family pseudouridine synthase [Sedimentisphaerales bacterium]|nr:RluA family pseudouridine synthase [Sedimentisphaerales bacterium]
MDTENPKDNSNNNEQEESAEQEEDGAQHASVTINRMLPDRRIDKYLKHRFPDFSRNLIQHLIKEEGVTVNGKAVKCSYQLQPRDKVDIILPPLPTNEIPPEDIPLNIIYEDEYLLVINKQANLIVHPARGNRAGTLVNGLVFYSDSLSQVNGQFRPGIVHRLDRNTTGVIVVAKTDTAHWRLAHQFEYRLTQKVYLAVVHGTMDLDADVISLPMGKHPTAREKFCIRPESGKHAITTYKVQKQYRGYALVQLMPKTGRTHQLRVHMSTIKHPVVADIMYGGKLMTLEQLANGSPLPTPGEPGSELHPDQFVIDRHALHAAELFIRHPISGKQMHLQAPLPNDMDLLISLLNRYRS